MHNTALSQRCARLSILWPEGKPHEATRVHHAARRRGGCVAARGARAAGRAHAAHRHAHEPRRGRSGRQARLAAFLQGLQQLGWTDGRNVQIDYRWAAGDADRIRKYAAELVALAPDVIVADGSPIAGPLQQATRTVPIVFVQVTDPVGAGFVESLARPGGNATGFTRSNTASSGKWLELLKEIAPSVTRAAVLRDPAIPPGSASSPPSRPWRRRSGWS